MKLPFSNRKQSIRGDLLRPFILSFLCTVALMAGMLILQSQKMVDQVLNELQGEMLIMLDRELNTRLGEAVQLSHISHDAMKNRILDTQDPQNRERFFSMMVKHYPNVTMSYVGLPSGEFYGARRNTDGSIDIARNNSLTKGHSEYYRIDAYGSADNLTQVFENFDPRIRPWYLSAQTAKGPVFSSIYSHFVFKEPTITASLPYYEEDRLVGIFGVDLLLTWLGEALSELPIGNNGLVFIVDQDEQLVATTTKDAIFRIVDNKSVNVSVHDVDNSVIRSILSANQAFNDDLSINNKAYMVSKTQYKYENLDWNIYIALMKDDFLEDLKVTLTWTLLLVIFITALFIVGTVVIVKRIVDPITKLNDATKKLEQGSYVALDLDHHKNEIYELNSSFNSMGQQIIHQVEILEEEVAARTKELEEKNEILKDLSYTDQLLHIGNRRRFDESGGFMFELANRSVLTFTIMMLDIDDFKIFNDTYGHVEGDNCLIKIASTMQESLNRKTDLLARYGGEEFVVAITHLTKEQVLDRAEHIRQSIEDLKIENIKTKTGFVTVSIGIAYGTTYQNLTLEQMVREADQAMYTAKVAGKNRCVIKEL
ncbi:diguanylate cyclase [Petrocella sp. FN5]|uniref:diguanylate cyclase n=1 Tax=Petrocella sp. FN5 TaxID=3032002 RepID=UPI0023DB3268|nr:diguanylate cyclase [Petrocella sp. FN5]MDF1618597.1 diguanylate cyclase [Petrocella sp. FN5]